MSGAQPVTGPDRRTFLTLIAGLAGGALLPPLNAGAFELTPGTFLSFSNKLNGLIPDQGLAELDRFFAAIQASTDPAQLRRLAELVEAHQTGDLDAVIADAGLDDLANTIVKAWYTGIVTDRDGTQHSILWNGALVWRALDFTKPPAHCDWISWADAPPTGGED
ncbi:MAG: hypothetical protein GY791_13910 [Alphaproteobacteria bacterium]|nr:hypothetical protein [Alphaproteobacteria bacterium]